MRIEVAIIHTMYEERRVSKVRFARIACCSNHGTALRRRTVPAILHSHGEVNKAIAPWGGGGHLDNPIGLVLGIPDWRDSGMTTATASKQKKPMAMMETTAEQTNKMRKLAGPWWEWHGSHERWPHRRPIPPHNGHISPPCAGLFVVCFCLRRAPVTRRHQSALPQSTIPTHPC